MAVRGVTVAERAAARAKRRRERRAVRVRERATSAQTSHQLLVIACNYALAVGKDLSDADERAFAQAIAKLADERNV